MAALGAGEAVDEGAIGVLVDEGVRVGRVVDVSVFWGLAGVMVAKVMLPRRGTEGVRNVSAAGVMTGVGRVLGCGR